MERKKVSVIKEDLAHHQEMERKKVSVIKEDLAHHQKMERKKVSVIKENLVLQIDQNQQVLQTIQNTLEKRPLKVHPLVESEKVLVLMERRSLRAEMIDRKALLLKSIVKKELKSKIF